MVGMILNVDARPFASALNQTMAHVLQSVAADRAIPAIDLFDTAALPVGNAAGRQQLERRAPLAQGAPGRWSSPGGFVPMRLRYQLFQANRPLRMDVSVKGALALDVQADAQAGTLDVALASDFTAVVLDPVRVGGQMIAIPDVLYLQRIALRPGRIDYAFRRKGDCADYITVTAAWSDPAVAAFGGKTVALQFSRETFATRALSAALASRLKAESCGAGGGAPGAHTLWARSSGAGAHGTCYVSRGCAPDTNPRGIHDINLGCYPSAQDAWAASDRHPMCQAGNYLAETAGPATVAEDATDPAARRDQLDARLPRDKT